MSDKKKRPANKPANKAVLPPQSSAADTSNWDDRAFIAPDGRDHIEHTIQYSKEERGAGIMAPRAKKQADN